jgi:hypothetical protein
MIAVLGDISKLSVQSIKYSANRFCNVKERADLWHSAELYSWLQGINLNNVLRLVTLRIHCIRSFGHIRYMDGWRLTRATSAMCKRLSQLPTESCQNSTLSISCRVRGWRILVILRVVVPLNALLVHKLIGLRSRCLWEIRKQSQFNTFLIGPLWPSKSLAGSGNH